MEKISDFQIQRELGRGGMGVVYEAIEEPLGRRVALKLLNPGWASQQNVSERFVDEARKIAKLSHSNIVRIYRFGHEEGIYYLALEYVDGSPLDTILAKERLPLAQSISILLATAQALGHAHEIGIVHRDIKPGNIFLRKDQTVVLGDFGIAKDLDPGVQSLTRTGEIFGTPAYMAPEQAMGRSISPATDIYSLGILAYELFTGRVPFTSDTAITLLMKHISETPPSIADLSPSLPRPLVDFVERTLEKDPANRLQNGNEVARILTAIQREVGAQDQATEVICLEERRPTDGGSVLDELEVTVVDFKIADFSTDTCQKLLPARVAFLLESWYRLVRKAVRENGGTIDRYVGGEVTGLFGFPERHVDHVHRALRAAIQLNKALIDFNKAHDLQLCLHAGIACGPALVGRIAGDFASTSAQGPLLYDMVALARTKIVTAPIRLNRTAYRRVHSLTKFEPFEEPRLGEAWASYGD